MTIMTRPHSSGLAQIAATVALFLFLLLALLSLGEIACYDPKSPQLPPCPEGGVGYTDPAGCFEQIRADILDGGRDAR